MASSFANYLLVVGQILAAWLVVFAVVTGLGGILAAWLRIPLERSEDAWLRFWLGLAVATAALQTWHLWFRIGGLAAGTLAAAGLSGVWRQRRDWRRWLAPHWPHGLAVGGGVLLLGAWLAAHAAGKLVNYDAGLYHLAAIRWAVQYPVVPGLGNLHGRLAFNNAHFLLMAGLDGHFWGLPSFRLMSGLVALPAIGQCSASLYRFLTRSAHFALADVFLLCAAAMLLPGVFMEVTSTSADVPVFHLEFFLTCLLLRLGVRASETETRYTSGLAGAAIILAALGIAFKLSFAVFGAITAVLALGAWAHRTSGAENHDSNGPLTPLPGPVPRNRGTGRILGASLSQHAPLAAGMLTAAVLIVPWLIRGIILSGWPVYPLALGGVDVPWRVPLESLVAESNWIKSWARLPYEHYSCVLADWAWFRPWLARLPVEMAVQIALLLAFGSALVALKCFAGEKSGRSVRLDGSFLLPAAGGLIFWFTTAPNPRFAGAVFVVLAAGALALFVDAALQVLPSSSRRPFQATVLGLAIWITVDRVENQPLWPPPAERLQALPRPELRIVRTNSGLELYVPAEGDQAWDAPLPSTPYPNARLRLRSSGNLAGGFVLERTERVAESNVRQKGVR